MMSQKSSGQEFSKTWFYQRSYASKTRSRVACCQTQKKLGSLDMRLLSARKLDTCEMEVASHKLYSPLNTGVLQFCWPGNKTHSARISDFSHLVCMNLNILIPWWYKQHQRVSKATQEACVVRDELFSDRYQITPPASSGKSGRGEQDKIYNVIAQLLVFESKTPILCEENGGNRCSRMELNG